MVPLKQYLILLPVCIMGLACSDSKSKPTYPAIDVIGYVKGQIKTLDSVPYGLLKVTERGGEILDSTYLNKKQFIEHITPFLHASINKEQLEKHYEETSFADAGLGYIVITYQPKHRQAPVDQIVVYIRPDNQSIHQVYISGHINPDKGEEKKQLLWLQNKGCTIITTHDQPTQNASGLTERIIWQ